MTTRYIEVPDFVAEEFDQPLRHPNPAKNSVDRSVDRVYRLVADALKNLECPDWDIGLRKYYSHNNVEPYCFSRFNDKFCIWIEERGTRKPLAVFKSSYAAAEYFVWLVSKGSREIDWSKFLEMEP